MLAVSNTSPISNLASIGRLDLLKSQFPVVWIPSGVAGELGAHPDAEALKAIRSGIREEWIRIATVQESHLLRVLLPDLHRGEAEAIALASDMESAINRALRALDRPVIDRSGLKGRFELHVEFVPLDVSAAANPGPSIFTALQEQAGLKLSPSRGPVEVHAIDSIERPSEN